MRLHSSIYPAHFGLTPGAQPVRKRSRRGRTPSWDGEFSSPKAFGSTGFESLLERDGQSLLSVDARIECYAVQPHRLTYSTPNPDGGWVKRTYTPDIVARTTDGEILIVEVKAAYFARAPKWASLEPHIREAYLRDHGARLLVFTEKEIRLQPRLANCQVILGHRPLAEDAAADMAVRDLLEEMEKPISIGAICDAGLCRKELSRNRVFSALVTLVLGGQLSIDMSQPIGSGTLLTGATM